MPDFDLIVIGAGAAGLSVTAGAAKLGVKVALIERDRMGGDCLNIGCVPSKALLAASHAATAARDVGRFGVHLGSPAVDWPAVQAHVRGAIDTIAPVDSEARFRALGATVLRGEARFVGPDAVSVDGRRLTARHIVVAAGSRVSVPPIPGLDQVPFLTNATLFDLPEQPEHLLILGGGPIGLEMADAFVGLGSRVTVVEAATIASREDPELVAGLRMALTARGVAFVEGVKVVEVEGGGGHKVENLPLPSREGVGGRGQSFGVITGEATPDTPPPPNPLPRGEGEKQSSTTITLVLSNGRRLTGSHLLVAVGRRPNLEDLDPDAGNVRATAAGIATDRGLRSVSNRRVFAVGDIADPVGIGPRAFTHVGSYHAGLLIRRLLFRLPAKVDYSALPRVTYTEPELAQVGLTEAEAHAAGHAVSVLRWPLSDNDRAQAERNLDGLVKLVVARGRVVGAGILAPHAGEMIGQWTLAIDRRIPISALAGLIAPYPTRAEAGKRAAGSYFTAKLFSARTKTLVRWLARLP
jgi:pyruvate/2-oxoglutarate dehydrogenase complex dihydrolipoamide dehydrogenase (E3) component